MHQRKKLLYIGNKLAAHGNPPTAIDTLSIKLEQEGYSIISASSKQNRIYRLLNMVFTTIRNRAHIDLVLIDTYSTQNFYYAVIIATLCRCFKVPYIPILHGGNLLKRLKKNQGFSKRLFGNAFANVAPSKYMLQQFQDAGFHNITYIPNSIEITNYPFLQRNSVTPKLLWVRSFSEIYNPQLALQIVKILIEKGMDASLCMVGPDKDGTLKHCKQLATELKLPVTFPGLLKKKKWIELSKAYSIFINTTNFDNMPISVMEAMALGMPVISTNVGGLPFLIHNEENGILVPANNVAAFVNAIEDLCNNPLKASVISKNARTKMEQYDWQEIKHKWIKLLGD